MKKIFFAILSVVLVCSCVQQLNAEPSFSGKWYAQQYGCRTVVTFNADSTLTIKSEANSSANMTVPFVVAAQTDSTTGVTSNTRYDFDLKMYMANQGVAIFDGADHLQIGVAFGPKEYVSRPVKPEDAIQSQGSLVLDLYRDSTKVTSVLDKKVDAPAEAKLAFERNKRLGKGVNMNGYVDANPDDGNDAPMTEQDFREIREAGFESVRIPITWVKHCAKEAPYTIDADFFKKIDWTIEQCFKNDLAVSIDLHYYPAINMPYDDEVLSWDENLVRCKSFWQQISEHYKDYSNDMLFFDLLNEPNTKLGADGLNKLHAELISIIRKTNPDRTLIVGTPNLGQTWTLGELTFPEGEWNIIVQGHYYLPHTFTHQNLSYVPSAMSGKQVEWLGTDEEKASIIRNLDFCKRWNEQTGRPVNIGEYGVCLNAPQESINRYLQFMQQQFRERGFSNHIWAYRGLFGVYDLKNRKWNQETLNALK